jgi:hypothetical protein
VADIAVPRRNFNLRIPAGYPLGNILDTDR